MMANGSWMDITVFKMSFRPVRVWILVKPATNRVGAIATSLNISNVNSANLWIPYKNKDMKPSTNLVLFKFKALPLVGSYAYTCSILEGMCVWGLNCSSVPIHDLDWYEVWRSILIWRMDFTFGNNKQTTNLVMTKIFHGAQFRFRKPCIANWPA